MGKLTIVRGVSGSGKSTWSNQQNAKVVSRDLIRLAMWGEESMNDEAAVTIAEHSLIDAFLKAGYDVISDNTNIEFKYVKAIAKIGYRNGADVEVKVFDVPLDVAVKNNERRAMMGGRHVPLDVIKRQHSRFQGSKTKQLEPVPEVIAYDGTPGKPKAFLVDIDGTLAHMRDYRGPFDWAKVGLDDVDKVVSDIVINLYMSPSEYEIIVMSGRDESSRDATEKWLNLHHIPFGKLFMRPAGDFRPDNIVKHELFNEYVRDNYDVQFVLDDRDQVVDMWRQMGLTCLQVAPGDF